MIYKRIAVVELLLHIGIDSLIWYTDQPNGIPQALSVVMVSILGMATLRSRTNVWPLVRSQVSWPN